MKTVDSYHPAIAVQHIELVLSNMPSQGHMRHSKGDIGVMQGLGFPRIRGTLLGVLIIGTIVFWGCILGSPI